MQSPIHEYERKITNEGKEYTVNIKSYEEPIRKNQHVTCHTRVSIMDGVEEWGHVLLPQVIEPEGSHGIFEAIQNNFKKFKNPK